MIRIIYNRSYDTYNDKQILNKTEISPKRLGDPITEVYAAALSLIEFNMSLLYILKDANLYVTAIVNKVTGQLQLILIY